MACIGTAYCQYCKEWKTGTCLCRLVCPDCSDDLDIPDWRKEEIKGWTERGILFKQFIDNNIENKGGEKVDLDKLD